MSIAAVCPGRLRGGKTQVDATEERVTSTTTEPLETLSGVRRFAEPCSDRPRGDFNARAAGTVMERASVNINGKEYLLPATSKV